MNDSIDNYEVNLQKVAEDKKSSGVLRLLAIDLQTNPYLSIGDWLQSLTDTELESLMNDLVDPGVEDENAVSGLILLSLMLSRAEQVFLDTDEDLTRAVGLMSMFIVMASVGRKGLAKIHYQNMSFGDDADHLCIAEKL